MALEIESVKPPSAIHLIDGDEKSMMAGDLEDGEIEDGEIPDEEACVMSDLLPETQQAFGTLTAKQSEDRTTSAIIQKVKKSGSAVNDKHVEYGKENVTKDDWASDVENSIKAAMGTKDKKFNVGDGVVNDGNKYEIEDNDERKIRRKKRKKRHKEDDEERKDSKKRKRSHGATKDALDEDIFDLEQIAGSDNDVEEDEMLFVRGASPIMRMKYSFSGHGFHDESFSFKGGPFEDSFEAYSEDSDYEREELMQSQHRNDDGPKRGGRGSRKRMLGRGLRGMPNKRQQLSRKDVLINKGKRLGNKWQQQRAMLMQDLRQGPDSVCMFYMQGKCQKGDDCPYSHDVLPPRKMELCKFYLMDCCAKKDKCLYMHSDFPCKFFHTGLKCFAGDKCKFSHGTLTETLRAILLKHLETAPKEILGDFPRLSREGAAAMVYNKKNRGSKGSGQGNKKIPSLFEIEVPIPAQLLTTNEHGDGNEERNSPRRSTPMPDSDNEDGSHTPMPSSPKEARNSSTRTSSRQWDADDGARPGDSGDDDTRHTEHCRTVHSGLESNREHSEEREVSRRLVSNYQHHDLSEQLKMRFYQETLKNTKEAGDGSESRHQRRHRYRHSRSKISEDEQEKRSNISLHHLTGYSPSHTTDSDESAISSHQDTKVIGGSELHHEGMFEINDQHSNKSRCVAETAGNALSEIRTNVQELKKEQLETDHNNSCSTEVGGIPLNLPKKQRELFLRIKQQQREAADSSSQDQSGDDDGKDIEHEGQQEENWYSSDEEEASLADVLKNLSKQQDEPQKTLEEQPSLRMTPPLSAPLPQTPSLDSIKLSDIDISESVSKLLSSIRHQQSAISATSVKAENIDQRITSKSHPSVSSTTQARDPRLVSRDPRNRSTNVTSISVLSPNTYETFHHNPRTSKRSNSSEEKSEVQHTSIYSSAITPLSVNTIQTNQECGRDIDLRSFLSRQQQSNSGYEIGTDVDLRPNMLSGALSSSYAYGDTDLRGDVDLRGMLGLPFKPAPMHTPATEIQASLTSHPPIPYRIVSITIPRPDYSGLKLNASDSQVQNDPRLRKLFKRPNVSSESSASPPPKRSPTTNIARSDPRRRSTQISTPTPSSRIQETQPVYSHSLSQNSVNLLHNTNMASGMVPPKPTALVLDPRLPKNPRNAPGLLGPAPLPHNYCPNTPMYEEGEDGNSNGSDTDLRLFYNSSFIDRQGLQSQNQHIPQNRNWKNSRHMQHYLPQQDQQRSFTPPL